MTNETLNLIRMILLAAVVLILALTAILYFKTGEFYFAGFVVAGCCAVIVIITGRKGS